MVLGTDPIAFATRGVLANVASDIIYIVEPIELTVADDESITLER